MNQSIHSIDLLQWFMGPVHSLHAYTGTRAHQMECEDVAVIALRFANGALGTISATTGAYPGMATRIEIYGDQGSVIIENDQLHSVYLADSTTARADQYKANTSTVNIEAGPAHDPAALQIEIHARQIADMLHAIREDTEPLVDGYAARHSVEIILGAYESARTGKEVILA